MVSDVGVVFRGLFLFDLLERRVRNSSVLFNSSVSVQSCSSFRWSSSWVVRIVFFAASSSCLSDVISSLLFMLVLVSIGLAGEFSESSWRGLSSAAGFVVSLSFMFIWLVVVSLSFVFMSLSLFSCSFICLSLSLLNSSSSTILAQLVSLTVVSSFAIY